MPPNSQPSSHLLSLWLSRIGRWLMATLFLAGAVQKLTDPAPVLGMLDSIGLPTQMVWIVAAFNFLAGVMFILGLYLGPLALSLAAYCLATSYFHFIPEDGWQMSIFIKNWAIAGGLLCLASRETKSMLKARSDQGRQPH